MVFKCTSWKQLYDQYFFNAKQDSTVENNNVVEKEINVEERKTTDEVHEGEIDISLTMIMEM